MNDNMGNSCNEGKQGLTTMQNMANNGEGRLFLLEMMPKHAVCAEIGVHRGEFSQKILEISSPEKLHLVDPWVYHEGDIYKKALYGGVVRDGQKEMDERYQKVCTNFENEIHNGNIQIHRGYSEDILNEFHDEYFDWIYIDGNHLYEYIKKDLELSCKKTKAGGFITGDDYTIGGWWEGGVKKAVDELINNVTLQLILIRNRQFIFQKK